DRLLVPADASNVPANALPATHAHALSRLDGHVTPDCGLASQDGPLGFVVMGQRLLHGHLHTPRDKLDTARSACAPAARIIDEHANLVSRLEDRRTDRHWYDRESNRLSPHATGAGLATMSLQTRDSFRTWRPFVVAMLVSALENNGAYHSRLSPKR